MRTSTLGKLSWALDHNVDWALNLDIEWALNLDMERALVHIVDWALDLVMKRVLDYDVDWELHHNMEWQYTVHLCGFRGHQIWLMKSDFDCEIKKSLEI